jgi:PAS domain S-box-containing protein
MADSLRTVVTSGFRWRFVLLATAIVAIVVLPFAFSKRANDDAIRATERVAHTSEVKAAVNAFIHAVRDVEAASLALAAGLEGDIFRTRVNDGLRQLPDLLEGVKQRVADNPDQLMRLGQLQNLVDNRLRLTQDALLDVDAARFPQALATLQLAADQYRLRDMSAEIVAVEEALLADRRARAEALQRAASWLAIGAAAAQLVLLGLVTFLAERQTRQRLGAESESRRAVSRAQAVVQTVREPIVLLDRDLRILMRNGAFDEIYGSPADASEGAQALSEAGGGAWSDALLLQRLSEVAARDRELWDHELEQRGSGGRERTVMVNARRMQLPDRDDSVIVMTVADVTAHKHAERQIRELNRQLEGKVEQISEVNRELEAFSYSVSHDLRAPLRHIAGFSEKLDRHLDQAVDDKARHYLDVIGSSARRMAGLIDDLLVYSRLGRHALRLQSVDMQTLVDEARQILGPETESRSVEWRIEPLPIVVADENMMRQVWQNLLGNAVKYSARRARAVIEVGSRMQEDGSVLFSVRDNGAGFDMAYAGKLFGVFQRLHKASEFSGSGIGLANVRRILLRHGGRVWAEAVADEGATFFFTLPPPSATASTGT